MLWGWDRPIESCKLAQLISPYFPLRCAGAQRRPRAKSLLKTGLSSASWQYDKRPTVVVVVVVVPLEWGSSEGGRRAREKPRTWPASTRRSASNHTQRQAGPDGAEFKRYSRPHASRLYDKIPVLSIKSQGVPPD